MKSKDVNKIHKYFNEPIEHGELFFMSSRYGRFEVIICETYENCYKQALEEVNKLFEK